MPRRPLEPDVVTTWAKVASLRFERQFLARRAPATRLIDVVGAMVGLQAQVTSAAELQLAARVDGLRRDDIRDAIADRRSLVKTWAMRGTLHWLTADDLVDYVAAYPTRDNTNSGAWIRYFGMQPEDVEALAAAVGKALGATPLTRAELAAAVAGVAKNEAVTKRLGSGWGELLKPAAGRGRLVFGPDRGRNVTFVDPNDWLDRRVARADRKRVPEPLVALGRLIDRWLRVFAGADREATARWWGVQRRPTITGAIAAADLDVEVVGIEGATGWVRRGDLVALAEAEPVRAVRLLPMFDPWTNDLPRKVDALLPTAKAERVYRTAGWISAVVLVDGRIAGTWELESGSRGGITVQPFGRWRSGVAKELAVEADRFAAFLDRPLKVSVPRAAAAGR